MNWIALVMRSGVRVGVRLPRVVLMASYRTWRCLMSDGQQNELKGSKVLVPVIRSTFPLGTVVVTTTVEAGVGRDRILEMLRRHATRDWGSISAVDAVRNDWSVLEDERLMSAYPADPKLPCKGLGENCVLVITEGDRSVTTVLYPGEY